MTLRYGFRWIARRPLSTFSSVVCLAIGISACAVAWTIVDAILMRPFNLRDARRLAVLWEADDSRALPLIEVSLLNFLDWQREAKTVEAMAAMGSSHWPVLARLENDTVPLVTRGVSQGFFATLGVHPVIGRGFQSADLDAAAPPPIILSHRLWSNRFRADPAIAGRTLFADGTDHRIVGVMPQGFGFPDDPDAWISVERVLAQAFQNVPEPQQRMVGLLEVVAKRRAAVTNEDVERELTALARTLRARHGATDQQIRVTVTPLSNILAGELGARLWIAIAMAVTVLLFACANVAAVRLAHGRERAHELVARVFLGAARRRLALELALEVLPALVVVGLLAMAMWFALIGVLSESTTIAESGVNLFESGNAVAIVVALTALAWLLVGIAPAWWQARVAERAGTMPATRALARTTVVGVPVVMTQAMLAIVAVAVAAGAIQAFEYLSRIELGFSTRGVMFVDVAVPDWKYKGQEAYRALLGRLEQSLREVPEVAGVAAVSVRPFRFGAIVDGQPVRKAEDVNVGPEAATGASRVIASPGYFDALGLPIVTGRAFTAGDRADTQPVAIVSRTLARTLWGDAGAVGRRIDTFTVREKWQTRVVVGIAGDARYRGLERPSMEVYVPDTQAPAPLGSFVTRSASGRTIPEHTIREALRRVEPDIAIDRLQSTADLHREVLSPSRLLATLMSVLGAAGVLLLAVGIFGATATALRAAWAEIAVRQAIGALPWQAAGAPVRVLGRALVAGVGLGLLVTPAALSATAAAGLTRDDSIAVPLAAAAAVVLSVAALATLPSLRKAARSSPAELLRTP